MSTATGLTPPYPVKVHSFPSPSSSTTTTTTAPLLQTYEHIFPSPSSPEQEEEETHPQNALIFLGGLGDGPHTLPYVRRLAARLSSGSTTSGCPPYAVFEARLSSAFTAFGHASLAQDARELAALVRHLRRRTAGLAGRVVLMGHSTGCQGCLEYGTRFWRGITEEDEGERGETRVDGIVLQGPVSDREAIGMVEDRGEVERALRVAEGLVREGKGGEVMERELMPRGWRGSPVTAYRWVSLAAVGGDDDYFSSDLPDQRVVDIWAKLEVPVLILPSEKDEWVPSEIDVSALVNKWKGFCKPGIASELSGLIPSANHRVEDVAAQEWLADRVARFLAEIGE